MFNRKMDYTPAAPSGSAADPRVIAERENQERIAARQQFLVAQSSTQYDPQRRIRLWEQLHSIHLPRSAEHSLVGVIAAQTALTVEQVRQEQVRRAAEAESKATATAPLV